MSSIFTNAIDSINATAALASFVTDYLVILGQETGVQLNKTSYWEVKGDPDWKLPMTEPLLYSSAIDERPVKYQISYYQAADQIERKRAILRNDIQLRTQRELASSLSFTNSML